MTANDADVDGTINLASVVVTQQPTNGVVTVNANGSITYVSNSAEVTPDSFQYTVNDNTGATSNVATVSINIVNQAPVAEEPSYELEHQHYFPDRQRSGQRHRPEQRQALL